jgi:nucleotide-binding universal stress UspA family protein
MISEILVPMDGSEMAEHALEYALENHPDADVTVLHVAGEPGPMWAAATTLALADDLEEAAAEKAEPVFERASEIAAERDATVETAVAVGSPARAILNRVDDYDAVVVGSHGGSLADRLLVGNVAQSVFRRSPVPVTVVR